MDWCRLGGPVLEGAQFPGSQSVSQSSEAAEPLRSEAKRRRVRL